MQRHRTTIEIIDREGWRKELPLEKTIIYIGSASRNDIVLEPARGGGVEPLHVQLIVANGGAGYRLVNLGNAAIPLDLTGEPMLSPHAAVRMADGMSFKLGDFTLIFHGAEAAPEDVTASSGHIGLKVSLSEARLRSRRSINGVLTVSNLGDRSGAQFNLELEGLESECYDIEPGPILSAGTEKEVLFHLYHRGDTPLAGDRTITIYAVAPNAYPGEQARVSRVIQVQPHYAQRLRLVLPGGVAAPPAPARPVSVQPQAAAPPLRAEPVPVTPEEKPEDKIAPPVEAEEAPAPEAEAVAAKQPPAEPGAEAQGEIQTPPRKKEEKPAAPAVTPPPVAGEWGTPEAEAAAAPPAGERRVLKMKAAPLPEAKPEPAPPQPEAGPTQAAEDWWATGAPAGAEPQPPERQVLKLKAPPPSEAEAQPPPVAAGPATATEDWWAAESEVGPGPQPGAEAESRPAAEGDHEASNG